MRLALLSRLRDACFDALSKEVALELGKDRQHSGKRPTRRRGEVNGFRERDEADTEVREFFESRH